MARLCTAMRQQMACGRLLRSPPGDTPGDPVRNESTSKLPRREPQEMISKIGSSV